VWKCQCNGQEVAAKALRVYLRDDLQRIRRVGCPLFVVCIDDLTVSHTEVLQGGCGVELPSSSECVAAVGRDDDRESVRGSVRVDARWQYQRVCENECDRGSIEACMSFVQGPCSACH
jgi:hypothetical protein